ncbi:uncharacterized protein TRIREDRAFT_109388 [Trichoderma reesei QM6a]|uniref:Predicted protein n=2 Tax=Hypocrea jecorina TaxID=51453 RepID=G0RP35_HYPJQ|nr:uncharacterized protein TRIREDRAFT_109388 [Trichoderma reesei QM6a]EGR47122.1 predicted protein [Trichoderma reesei QM6a]ETR99655.1 hypothetical protein M419DRAFT_85186 [Trichoderma reesei RUT C-30]
MVIAGWIRQVDEVRSWHYDNVNNGVYKSGVATSQEAYERALTELAEQSDSQKSISDTMSRLSALTYAILPPVSPSGD